MFEKFDDQSVKAILLGILESRRMGHNFIGTEHILLGLIAEGRGVAAKTLASMGAKLDNSRAEAEKIIGRGSSTFSGAYNGPESVTKEMLAELMLTKTDLGFTPRCKQAIRLTRSESERFGHQYVRTEHLLWGLLKEYEVSGAPAGVATIVLEKLGIDQASFRRQVIRLLELPPSDQPPTKHD